jgi:hypothetical protein
VTLDFGTGEERRGEEHRPEARRGAPSEGEPNPEGPLRLGGGEMLSSMELSCPSVLGYVAC